MLQNFAEILLFLIFLLVKESFWTDVYKAYAATFWFCRADVMFGTPRHDFVALPFVYMAHSCYSSSLLSFL